MNWQDILLERCPDNATLTRALAAAFDAALDDVGVVDSIEMAPSGVAIVAEQTSTKGDFRCLLSLYVVETLAGRDPIEVTRRLCGILNVQALISDKSPNPYSMILINKERETHAATLEVEGLDVRQEYRLSREPSDGE
jgi:hypothetical protein